jgi:hypothetical protein
MVEYDTHRGKTIDDLLGEIDDAWQRLMNTMTAHPEEAYAEKRDEVGWTPLDHLAHITAWEKTALYPLQGKSRHEGLGVTDEQFLMDFDPLNQIVREQTVGNPYDVTMEQARATHAELVEAVKRADVETLWQPSSALASDTREQRRETQVPFIEILMSDACEHFDEHREFIEKILAS